MVGIYKDIIVLYIFESTDTRPDKKNMKILNPFT